MRTLIPANRYFFAEDIASLLAIREAEKEDAAACTTINTVLDILSCGINDLDVYDRVLAHVECIRMFTTISATNTPWSNDGLECPYESELSKIENHIRSCCEESHGNISSLFPSQTFGDMLADEDIPF